MEKYSEKHYDKLYEKVNKWRNELAKMYEVSASAVVWIGNNHFMVCKDNQTIKI